MSLHDLDEILSNPDGWAKTRTEKIKAKYWNLVPYDWRPGQIWYRFKCWAWYRYTTVKPRALPDTWMDRDTILEHMAFEILSQFIEKEKPDLHFDIQYSPNKLEWSRLFALYIWWRFTYLPAWKAGDDDDALEVELTKNLHELIELRGHLWT